MKLFLFIALFVWFAVTQTFGQVNNDLLLLKPVINFNDTNGGFYSEYYKEDLTGVYCGAIVKNVGNSDATGVYLKIQLLNGNNSVISTYYSDTIPNLATYQIDTINLQQSISITNLWNFRFVYEILSDSTDENEINNIDTLPATDLYESYFGNYVSRANIPTDTFSVNKIPNFTSGDFIGVTLTPNQWHYMVSISVYFLDYWPDSLILTGKMYQNGNLIDSMILQHESQSPPFWTSDYNYPYPLGDFLDTNNTYSFCIELQYPSGTNIPIGIDTSSFHNFNVETVAKIDTTWTTLNFVPLIRIVCDPEGIQSITEKNNIQLYPNPANQILFVNYDQSFTMEISDITGKLLLKSINKETDISTLKAGVYLVTIKDKTGKLLKTDKLIINR